VYVGAPARFSASQIGHYAQDRLAMFLAWRLGIDRDDPQ
jgi:hypothetical protein